MKSLLILSFILCGFLLVSCENKELVKESEELERELSVLNDEYTRLRTKIRDDFDDNLSEHLEAAKVDLEDAKGKITRLNEELAEVEVDVEKARV
ncbi:MAG: hypothetical protein AAGC74_13990, partial [Verrucomicrobiota bacterium]